MQNLNLNALNEVQKQAVEKIDGAVLVTAGAGSGKTRVLTYRIAYLIEKGVPASHILAVTFTNKAASEMKERITSLLGDSKAHATWIFTFHSMCVKLLRENHNIERFSGYTTNFSIYDATDRERILKTIVAEHNIEEKDYVKKLDWHISNYKNKNMTLEEYKKEISYDLNAKQIIDMMRSYETKMNASNALDFDSLLTYTYELLLQNPDILAHYQTKFEYILVDEFQDTNKVQYDLIKLFSSTRKNVFVVGDEDQCIYTWRGANSTHIRQFLTDFIPVTLFKLEQNYRSTKKIIALANKVIQNNVSRIEKNLWTEREDGVKVEYQKQFNEQYEASYVADTIYSLTHTSGYSYSDIAVLMRLNAQTRQFENKLLEYNIPYQVYGGMKFYDRLEVKNALAYLKLLVNPKDTASFNRIINMPKRGIGDSALLQLKELVKEGESPYETVMALNETSSLPSTTLNKFLSFQHFMKELTEKANTISIANLLEQTLDLSGTNVSYQSGSEEDISRLYNLSELIHSVKEFEKNNETASLEEYLQSVSLTADIDTYDENKNLVTLTTVHSVKGLEFKVIFIVGCEESIFPLNRRDSTDYDMEEERRLMYVAITRAKERLFLTSATERYLYGETSRMVPSRFLKEAELIVDQKPLYEEYHRSTSRRAEMTSKQVIEVQTTKVNVKSIVGKIKANDIVLHPKFGRGVVLSISGDTDTKTATIHFEGVGTKTLALNFAPLTIL